MRVYLLWHVSHQNEAGAGGTVLHHSNHVGEVHIDEQDGDDVKLLGVYSSQANAEESRQRARLLPGFADEPDCFVVGEYTLDADAWTEGFVRVPPGD